MPRRVKGKYSFALSDRKAARLVVENLKRYTDELGSEKAKDYAERMAWEGYKKASKLLAANPAEEVLYYMAPRAIREDGSYDDDSQFSDKETVGLDVAASYNSAVRMEGGRTRTFVRLVGRDATFYEFGTGVSRNTSEHPYKKESGLSPIGRYGHGHGSDYGGWYLPRDKAAKFGVTANGRKVTLLRSRGIHQARVLYHTALYLKKMSPSIAKQAFKGL